MVFKRRNRGFTLIEMSISTMILCVATVALAGLLVQGMRGWSSGTAQDNVVGQVSIALQKLSSDIRDGTSASVYNNMLIVQFPTTITDSVSKETMYDFSSTNTTTRKYFVQSGNLVRMIGSSTQIIGRGVNSASFHTSANPDPNNPTPPGSVLLELSSTEKVGGSCDRHLAVTGIVRLRNYRP